MATGKIELPTYSRNYSSYSTSLTILNSTYVKSCSVAEFHVAGNIAIMRLNLTLAASIPTTKTLLYNDAAGAFAKIVNYPTPKALTLSIFNTAGQLFLVQLNADGTLRIRSLESAGGGNDWTTSGQIVYITDPSSVVTA